MWKKLTLKQVQTGCDTFDVWGETEVTDLCGLVLYIISVLYVIANTNVVVVRKQEEEEISVQGSDRVL